MIVSGRHFHTGRSVILTAALALGSCGKGKSEPSGAAQPGSGQAAEPAPPPLAVPPLGAESVRRFNYPYGDGANAFERALAAYKAKTRDWATVRAQAEAALAKDAFHLEAHRLLAAAMINDGDYSAAAPHLLAAMAGDWMRFGQAARADAELATFWASPVGKQAAAAADALGAEHTRRALAGMWVLGRRASFRLPAKPGAQSLTSRGELYAYDRELRRFLRLSATDHSLVGFVRAPSGRELALVGYDRVELAADASGKAIDGKKPVTLARPWALALDAATFLPIGKRATLPKGRRVVVGYGAGEQLVASAAPADGRWGVGAEAWVAIDRTTGKTTKTSPSELEASVAITLEDAELYGRVTGAASADDSAELDALATAAGTAIAIPESGKASRSSVAVSPTTGHVAFATVADPCSDSAAPSLYVADGKTGALRHVLTGKSRFFTRWLDATTLAYDDPDGMVRLWDAQTGREVMRLAEKTGLSLGALAMSPAPVCRSAPPTAETGSEGEPPVGEPPADGPVVAPAP